MKTRVLKPRVQSALTITAGIIALLLGSLDDFEMSALPLILGLMAMFIIIAMILNKYGR